MSSVVKELRSQKTLFSSPRVDGRRGSIPIGFDKEQAYLQLMLKNAVLGDSETGQKQSGSVIVYGVPGSGKTTLVESALAELKKNYEFKESSMIVRLDGLLCPDFKSAVDEICFALTFDNPFQQEGEGEEDADQDGNDNDVEMECLEKLAKVGVGNFDDRLEQMTEFLKTEMAKLDQSIIFILDKLDLFAEHPNQHLLYNLFDITANSKSTIPICVIGITDRLDVLEMFEKRVKSRFSHRNINLMPTYDFEKYKEIATRLLSFEQQKRFQPSWKLWNENITKVVQENRVQQILRAIFEADPTILRLSSYLFSVLILVEETDLNLSHFEMAYEKNVTRNEPIKVALDLSCSELLALLSIYKHTQNKKLQAWQPANLYRIIEKQMASFGLGKEDYLKTISKLENLQLIIPVSNTQRNIAGVNSVADLYYKCELTYQEFQEIWKNYPQLPSSFKEFL